jgi:hypothetical protein
MATCFVAMPISVPDEHIETYSDRGEHFSHVLNHLFTPAIKECGYDVIPPAASGSDLIHAEIIRNLEQADLVLCDISCLNPNVFFELGIRTALDRPAAIVKDNNTKRIPFDTGSINTYTYDASLTPWSLKTQVPSLSEHIRHSIERADGRNPLWRYFGLTQRASPAEIADPTQAKIDLILSTLTQLRRPSGPLEVRGIESNSGKRPDDGAELSDLSLVSAVEAALEEGRAFGQSVAAGAQPQWVKAVVARKPKIPKDLETTLFQGRPIDWLLNSHVRAALRSGFWIGLQETGNYSGNS